MGLEDLASLTGNVGAEILSSHSLVVLMEQATRDAIERSLSTDHRSNCSVLRKGEPKEVESQEQLIKQS